MMRIGMNKLSYLTYEQDILQIFFDSRDEFDIFIGSADRFVNLEGMVNNVSAGPNISNLIKMLNDNIREESDGTVWTFVFTEHMPAVFLAFCNCIGLFNVFCDNIKNNSFAVK